MKGLADDLKLRQAIEADLPFIERAIVAAEQLPIGAGQTMYGAMLDLSSDEVLSFIRFSLQQDAAGHPLARASFFVTCGSGKPIACCAAWIEGTGLKSSGLRTALLMSEFLGRSRWASRIAAVRAVSEVAPKRTPGALQLESFFVDPECRGLGLTGNLIAQVTQRFLEDDDSCPLTSEISLLVENHTALRAYRKSGFSEFRRTDATEEFTSLTGSSGYILLSRQLTSSTSTLSDTP